jgi:tetratricopeptide (TPR) repeat protein
VSCLAEQAKILFAEAEENNLFDKANKLWHRWHMCGLCEQKYHGVVSCALGWACWKTYVGRPDTDYARRLAMGVLGSGLFSAKHYEDSLSVKESELSMMRRLGASERNMLVAQSNLAGTYEKLGLREQALPLKREAYFGFLRLDGEEDANTFREASNYANCLVSLRRFEEAKSLLRKTIPVARRVSGDNDELTLHLRTIYAAMTYYDPDATVYDLREAVETLEDTARIARRVFGGGHPLVETIESDLEKSRTALREEIAFVRSS